MGIPWNSINRLDGAMYASDALGLPGRAASSSSAIHRTHQGDWIAGRRAPHMPHADRAADAISSPLARAASAAACRESATAPAKIGTPPFSRGLSQRGALPKDFRDGGYREIRRGIRLCQKTAQWLHL
ncbi:MAG: hypothetical protein AB7I68_15320, partial [Porticoccaceae bacterium]